MSDPIRPVTRRRRGNYFPECPSAPASLSAMVTLRAAFGAVDAMSIVWHGRYAQYCEEAYAALTRRCGLAYGDFYAAGVRAPVVQHHVDHFEPLRLEEEFEVRARLVWSEGARMNVEYLFTHAGGRLAAAGYSVHMFTDVEGTPLLTAPPLIESQRRRWQEGAFACLQG